MTLMLTVEERVSRARADLRIGAPIALQGPALSGSPGSALVIAAETVTDRRLGELRALAPEKLDLAITARRAETLRARAYDGTLARIALWAETDRRGVHPGHRRSLTGHGDADEGSVPHTPRRLGGAPRPGTGAGEAGPGPARGCRGDLERPDPCRRCRRRQAGLALLTEIDLARAGDAAIRMRAVSAARVPTRFASAGRVHVFRPDDGAEEHYAVEVGQPSRQAPVLARLHSACFTGDVIGSLKCDCGPQLDRAMTQIGETGAGVLLYMNQEGRGIGLANKMRAYALQDEGFDTVEANHRLGFEDDERDFRLGAEILKAMGFSAVRLLTNNPSKVAMMEASGVAVTERVPIRVGETDENRAYLATKAAKSGHLL